jgi:putative peptidoglycan lipid II flippase
VSDSPAARPSLGRTFGLVAILTVGSKIAGLARDVIVAQEYGTSVIADAYNFAYLFTGNVLVLFGGLGGPFHSSTVAVLTPRRHEQASGALMAQVFLLTAAALSAITLIMFGLSLLVVPIASHTYGHAPGLSGLAELQHLFQTQVLTQLDIMLPLIVLAGLVGVSYGILNVYNKVFWPSLSPAIASLAIIAAIGLSDSSTRLQTGIPLAVGTLAGAIGQFVAQVPDMLKLKLNFALTFKPEPGLAKYFTMLWPAVISTSVGQLTLYVDSAFALCIQQQGAWTAIVNSNRLVQLPLGILLTALLVPILPRFTEQAAANKPEDLKQELARGLRFLWFLGLPMTAILLAIPGPIVQVLFQRGHFDQESAALVTAALVFLVPMIFFYVARDLITRVFYAYQDSKTPYYVALMALFVKALLDYLCVSVFKLGVAGISLATTLITIFNLGMLTWFLRKKIGHLQTRQLIQPVAIMLAGSLACALATVLIYNLVMLMSNSPLSAHMLTGSWGHWLHWFWKLLSVATASLGGLGVYVLICAVLRLEEPSLLSRRLLGRLKPGTDL